jgi:hypothetical protein
VLLHHNNHVHYATASDGADTTEFVTMDHDDGTGVWYEARLIVTDDGALTDSVSLHLFPENDLEPSIVRTNADHLAGGSNAEYEFWLRNHGRLLAHTSRWRLMANTTMLAEGDTLVPALDSVLVHVTPAPLGPGTYTLRAVADTLGSVVETNETNNASVRPLVIPGAATAVGDGLPTAIALSNPYPNPTRGDVAFALALPRSSEVSFDVLDLQGRVVWNETPRRLDPGRWTLGWNGRTRAGSPAPSGLYLARVRIDGQARLKRMALLR